MAGTSRSILVPQRKRELNKQFQRRTTFCEFKRSVYTEFNTIKKNKLQKRKIEEEKLGCELYLSKP
jgi:hypothetical protein